MIGLPIESIRSYGICLGQRIVCILYAYICLSTYSLGITRGCDKTMGHFTKSMWFANRIRSIRLCINSPPSSLIPHRIKYRREALGRTHTHNTRVEGDLEYFSTHNKKELDLEVQGKVLEVRNFSSVLMTWPRGPVPVKSTGPRDLFWRPAISQVLHEVFCSL